MTIKIPNKINRFSLFLLVLVFNCGFSTYAQTYSLKIKPSSFTLEGVSYEGYSSIFVQPYKEVKKEWWRYVNARTIIFNKKTHLELTVPAKGKEVNEPLKFVTQSLFNKSSKQTTIRLALVTDNIPTDQKSELTKKAHDLLKDFKVNYFIDIVQEKIVHQEKVTKQISLQMDKLLLENSKLQLRIEKKPEEKNQLASKLKANTADIEKLQLKLNEQTKKLNQYKKELTLIK